MSFYLFLPSNVSPLYFPKNRISAFQVKLPKRIKFNPNEYEVAITEFTYVQCIKTYFPETDRFIRFIDEPRNGISNLDRQLIPNYNYSDPQNLVMEINKMFLTVFGDEIGHLTKSKSNKVILNVKRGQIWFSKLIGDVLGFTNSCKDEEGRYIFNAGIHAAENLPLRRGGMHHIFVYSDIVKTQIVGDSMVPLLRIVNITGEFGEVVTQTFRPYYLPIDKLEFDIVEILLCNEFGEEIIFEEGQSIVTLHFKKTNNGHKS